MASRGKKKRIALWALGAFGALLLLVLSGLAAGGWWLEHRFLKNEIRFGEHGENRLRVYGAELRWNLSLGADSVWFRSPGLDARAGKISMHLDLLRGIAHFRPAAALAIDSVYLRLRTEPHKKKTVLDSVTFPDFGIPVGVSIRLRGLRVDDDSGMLVRARDLRARTAGSRAASAEVGWVVSRWTRTLPASAKARADWSAKDSVDLRAEVRRGPDRAALTARHAKAPLWRGRDSLDAQVADSRPYAKVFGQDSLPTARDVRLQAFARLSTTPELRLRLRGETAAHRVSPDFALSPQTVDLSMRVRNDSGSLRLQSLGRDGEDLLLEGEGRRLAPRGDSTPLWEQASIVLRGHARNFRVRVRDTLRTADVELERASWDGGSLSVDLFTGDSSRLEARARHQDGRAGWKGSFALRVARGERWVRAFTGDQVSFSALAAQGTLDGSAVNATVTARDLAAYGVRLDSLRAFPAYGPEGFTLKPSFLYAKKTAWTASGSLVPAPNARAAPAYALRLENREHGSLSAAQKADGSLEAKADRFEIGALPYAKLDSLPLRNPVLDGTLRWDRARKTGSADLAARGKYNGRDLSARVSGNWDARRLEIGLASVRFDASTLNVKARLRLDGRQFYQAAYLKPAQYQYLSVETPGFDIAEALKIFQPDPALAKGSVKGELSYNGAQGFDGTLVFDALTPRDAVGDVTLKTLRLEGRGDTLRVVARTESPSMPLLNDSLRISVSGALADSQRVVADIVAGDSLRVHAEAGARRFQALKGSLEATGGARLPAKSGSIDSLRVLLDFEVPFANPAQRARVKSRAFTGVYALPGSPRQRITLDPSLQDGVFRVEHLAIGSGAGQQLSGRLEYLLARGSLKAHLEGSRFTAQWTEAYSADLGDLNLDYARDSGGARLSGSLGEATLLYADAPLYATGKLTDLKVDYTEPPASLTRSRFGENPATLRLSVNLSHSLIRYRLKTFSDLQKTFRKDGRKKRSGSGPPLRLDVSVQTLGDDNRIDSDLLRLRWVGNVRVRGTGPYTLFDGRVNALDGAFGLGNQAYDIRSMEIKWLNAPLDEGTIHLEARKALATTCRPQDQSMTQTDSCTVLTRLDGPLGDMRFTYDSDCGGAFGAGASVAAILYSVERGCYDASLATGQGGGYGEKALTLLEPTLSHGLSKAASRYSGSWIEQANVTGLGSLSADDPHQGDSLDEALSLEVVSKEFLRLRFRARSGYHTSSPDLSNPWEHMAAIEWRPPLAEYIDDPVWRRRLMDNFRAVASVQTLPVRRDTPEEDQVQKQVGLTYSYAFWGAWWSKPRRAAPTAKAADSSGAAGEPK